jgi:hypothetical protein
MNRPAVCCGFAASIMMALGVLLVAGSPDQRRGRSLQGLAFDLQTDKASYLPGEPVELVIRVTNRSSATVLISPGFDVWVGHVEIRIAYENSEYKAYKGPGWGLRDIAATVPITLAAGRAFSTQATILYNRGVGSTQLNARARKAIAEDRLEEGYALATPGRYQIKAVLYGHAFADKVESRPVVVAVSEPGGADKDVWSALEADPELGYFIQAAGPRGDPAAPRSTKLPETLEKIMSDYPSSRYADAIRRSVSEYRAVVEDLRERGLIQ